VDATHRTRKPHCRTESRALLRCLLRDHLEQLGPRAAGSPALARQQGPTRLASFAILAQLSPRGAAALRPAGRGGRRCACCRPDRRRTASSRRCLWRGRAATRVDANVALVRNELGGTPAPELRSAPLVRRRNRPGIVRYAAAHRLHDGSPVASHAGTSPTRSGGLPPEASRRLEFRQGFDREAAAARSSTRAKPASCSASCRSPYRCPNVFSSATHRRLLRSSSRAIAGINRREIEGIPTPSPYTYCPWGSRLNRTTRPKIPANPHK
jgi:hypothetical protein